MIREYRNREGNKITEKQLPHMEGSYQVYNYDPDTFLLQEIVDYKKDEIFQIKYFKKDSENENDIINYLSLKNFYFVIISKEITIDYTILTVKRFNTKKRGLLGISKEVYEIGDVEYRYLICGQTLDKFTLQPILDKTLKFYYSIDSEGKKVEGVEFKYKENGDLDVAVDMTPDYNNHKNWDEYSLANFQRKIQEWIVYLFVYLLADIQRYSSGEINNERIS